MHLLNPLDAAQLFVCAFFAVLFLQSGLDKVFDYKGNLEWMTPHFAKSPMRSIVPMLLSVMTVIELSAGAVCGLGVVMLFFESTLWSVVGLSLCCLAFLCLFAGQRIAKDYAGAATIATYFGVALIGLYLFTV
jgi:uncharacterized membrane protein YphA (DoxX/SURF4 family)